jgi:hypothetical protein
VGLIPWLLSTADDIRMFPVRLWDMPGVGIIKPAAEELDCKL